MAVRIRMKKMGRKHRPVLSHLRDGRARARATAGCWRSWAPTTRWSPETDARAVLNGERIQYWLGVGAQPTDKVGVLIKKYGAEGTHVAKQQRGAWTGWPSSAAGPRRPGQPGAKPAAAEAAEPPSPRPKRAEPSRPPMRFDVLTLFPEIFPGTWVRAC